MDNYIFFDAAAGINMSPTVKQAMVDAPWGNSNSLHKLGLESKRLVKDTEEKILKLVNAPNGKIIWTSGGSQANQLISRLIEGRSTIEHKSLHNKTVYSFLLANEDGYINWTKDFFYLKNNSVQLANNELGTYQSIDRYKGQVVHSDCVQALGKYNIDVQQLDVQSITLSAHKIGGPKGIGCLWVSDALSHSFPDNHFTLNIPGIAGFSAALDEINIDSYQEKIGVLNETVMDIFTQSPLYNKVFLFNNEVAINRGSSIFSLQVPGVDATELMMRLSDKGAYVSTGSACSAGDNKPSHVLKAIGLTDEQALSTIRISLSQRNTVKEVIEGINIIIKTIKEIKNEANIRNRNWLRRRNLRQRTR